MNREQKLVKNTFILALGTFFPKLAIFIALPILTAYLTKDEYGTYDLVVTLVALILPAATLQLQSAAFRFLIDVQHDDERKKSIITNIFSFSIPMSVLTLIIMFFVLSGQSIKIRLVICVYFFLDMLINTNRQIIRGLGRNIDYSISSFLSASGQVAVTLLIVMGLKGGLLGALISLCIAEAIANIHLLIFGGILKYIDLKYISFAKTKEMLAYSWPMVPNSLSQWVIRASDKVVITFFMGAAANAIFAVAYKIPSILTFAQATFNMAWQENATIVSKDDDAPAYYSSMFRMLFDVVAGAMAVLIGFTPILFSIFIKGDYADAFPHIPFLYIGMFFFTLSSFWGGIMVAVKDTKSVGFSSVVAAIVHLAIVFLLIKPLGLYAASISTALSYICLCAMRLQRVNKTMKLHYDWLHILFCCVLLFAQCVACYYQNSALNICSFAFGIVFCCLLNRNIIKLIFRKATKLIQKKLKIKK